MDGPDMIFCILVDVGCHGRWLKIFDRCKKISTFVYMIEYGW